MDKGGKNRVGMTYCGGKREEEADVKALKGESESRRRNAGHSKERDGNRKKKKMTTSLAQEKKSLMGVEPHHGKKKRKGGKRRPGHPNIQEKKECMGATNK